MSEATTAAPEPTGQTTFDSAFQAAVAEHAPAVEPAAETSEPATQEPSQTPEEKGTEPALAEEGSEDELLTTEEYDALKDNPKALRKVLNRAYTQHRQRMKPYEALIEALEKDPRGTAELLARQQGLIPASAQPVQPPANETVQLLKQSLGPEMEFLAEKLAPAFEQVVGNAIGPVQQNLRMQEAMREVEGAFSSFKERHSDWQRHEPQMAKLMKVFSPTVGPDGSPMTSQGEYLDSIYALATLNQTSAEATRKVVEKIRKSAESSESPESGVSANRVAPRPSGVPTLEEAFAAAKKGERWE